MSNELASSVPVQYSVTSDMQLGLKPSAPKSSSKRVSIAPSNKSVFSPQDVIMFDIPTGRPGSWLDQSQTYLKFSVQFQTTAAANASSSVYQSTTSGGVHLDNTAYSFFQRLEVYNGSNQLEIINQYGQLCNYLIDSQLSTADKAGLSPMIGSNTYGISVLNARTASIAQYSQTLTTQYPGDRSGLAVTAIATANGVFTNAPSYTFSLPIMSACIGVNSSKMLPLKDLSAPINVQFVLSMNDDAIVYGAGGNATSWQIVNAELVCCFVEIDDDRFNVSDRTIPQYISSKSYRYASYTIPANSVGQLDILVPIRASSLTQLITRFRNQANAVQGANATCAYRLSSSVSPNLSSYQWRISDRLFPQKPVYLYNGSNGTLVGSAGEACAELSKSFHAIGSTICNGSISHDMYNVAVSALGNVLPAYKPNGSAGTVYNPVGPVLDVLPTYDTWGNAFSIAQELEIFSNRNDTILCGVDTRGGNPIVLSLVIASTIGAGSIVADTFGQFDVIFKIEQGQMSAQF